MTRREMLLVQLMEEAAEVAQAASKCLRFGTNHTWPAHEGTAEFRLTSEVWDLLTLVNLCQLEGTIAPHPVDLPLIMQMKKEKVEKYLLLSAELGKLT